MNCRRNSSLCSSTVCSRPMGGHRSRSRARGADRFRLGVGGAGATGAAPAAAVRCRGGPAPQACAVPGHRALAWQVVITHRDSLRAFAATSGSSPRTRRSRRSSGRPTPVAPSIQGTARTPRAAWELVGVAKGARSWAGFAREAGVPSTNLHVGSAAIGVDGSSGSPQPWTTSGSTSLAKLGCLVGPHRVDRLRGVRPGLRPHRAGGAQLRRGRLVRPQHRVRWASRHMPRCASSGPLSCSRWATELTQRLVAAEARIDATKLRTVG